MGGIPRVGPLAISRFENSPRASDVWGPLAQDIAYILTGKYSWYMYRCTTAIIAPNSCRIRTSEPDMSRLFEARKQGQETHPAPICSVIYHDFLMFTLRGISLKIKRAFAECVCFLAMRCGSQCPVELTDARVLGLIEA